MNHPTRHLSLTDLVESLKGKVAAIPRSHVTEAVQRLIVTDQEIATLTTANFYRLFAKAAAADAVQGQALVS